jgi:hypothetical protein
MPKNKSRRNIPNLVLPGPGPFAKQCAEALLARNPQHLSYRNAGSKSRIWCFALASVVVGSNDCRRPVDRAGLVGICCCAARIKIHDTSLVCVAIEFGSRQPARRRHSHCTRLPFRHGVRRMGTFATVRIQQSALRLALLSDCRRAPLVRLRPVLCVAGRFFDVAWQGSAFRSRSVLSFSSRLLCTRSIW